MDERGKELLVIIVIALFLGFSVSYKGLSSPTEPLAYVVAILSFLVIIIANSAVKNLVAYNLETDITIKPWSIYRFGWRKDSHFKEPVPMAWVPLLLSLVTNAKVWWLAALQFSVHPRPEKVARRHHAYHRKADVTEWEVGMIALSGVVINLLMGIISWIIGFPYFAKLNIFYATWSMVPIANLDGTKILFGSRFWWLIVAIICAVLSVFAYNI